MLRLADYSRISFAALRKETGIEYDERMLGTLQLSRTQAQLDASAKDVKALAAYGIPDEVLERDGGVRAEPALAHVRDKIVGGLLMPKDETGHFKFTNALAKRAEQLRVRFCLGTEVKRLDVEGSQVRGVVTNWERMLVIKQPIGVVGAITPLELSSVAGRAQNFTGARCRLYSDPKASGADAFGRGRHVRTGEVGRFSGRRHQPRQCVGGDTIGRKLCTDPKVRKISFTGSTEVSRLLMRQCSDQIKRMSFELGGNAPFIVFGDADVDAAVDGAIQAKFRNAGQTCVSANRIYVQS